VSDRPANAEGEGFVSVAHPVLRVTVDRSPPEIEFLPGAEGGARRVRVADALSDIRSLQLLHRGRPQFALRSEDGVCDSPQETFRVEVSDEEVAGWSLRGMDAAGNAVERPLDPGGTSN